MKPYLLACLALLLAACGGGPPLTVDATAELKPLVETMNAAWASLDVAKAAPFYAHDAGLVFYDIEPMKYTGWAEYAAGAAKTIARWKSVKITVGPDFQAHRHGNVAWATYTLHYVIELKQGRTTEATYRVTDLMEFRNGSWVIVHEHVSVPAPDA